MFQMRSPVSFLRSPQVSEDKTFHGVIYEAAKGIMASPGPKAARIREAHMRLVRISAIAWYVARQLGIEELAEKELEP